MCQRKIIIALMMITLQIIFSGASNRTGEQKQARRHHHKHLQIPLEDVFDTTPIFGERQGKTKAVVKRGTSHTTIADQDYMAFIKGLYTTLRPTEIPPPPPSGPFYDFITGTCEVLLTRLSTPKVVDFIRVLRLAMRKVGSGYIMRRYIKKFLKTLRTVGQFRGKLVKDVARKFYLYLTARHEDKDKFFRLMNSIFTADDDRKFNAYVYELKQYGAGTVSFIERQTKSIWKDVVKDRFYDQSSRKQREIQNYFRDFMYEFLDLRDQKKILMYD